jgi:uncharacterized protein (DUF2235 family)
MARQYPYVAQSIAWIGSALMRRETAVGRNIILCFDGTNNEYAAVNTNVVKTYTMLDRTGADQFAYYQPGIGTFAPPGMWGKIRKWIVTRLDLAIAWLLVDHVCDGYRFLMRYYQDGDQIFIIGFSRGSYTARALAGMIHKVGLLSQGNEELIGFAWSAFRTKQDVGVAEGFKQTFCKDIKIRFLGLFDTVSSVGWAWQPQYLPYTFNNPSVETVRHAVSLDERRSYFVQNLWGNQPTDVKQVWFSGTHCDVGGGYVETESGLSKLSLRWMVDEAKASGLRFNAAAEALILPATAGGGYAPGSVTAPQHESLKGWWWIVEFIPKRIRDPAADFATRWILHAGRHRFVKDGATIHVSVGQRMRQVVSYRPGNLPSTFVETP